MYQKKLSIIIPTKNRQNCAVKCIRTLLGFPGEGYEVVVQDNSDDASLKEMLGDMLNNKKLKYSYHAGCLSFCDNFEKAVDLSSGDYLIMIGDDDCVFPAIVELTNIIREKGIDSVVYCTETTYMWPNAVQSNYGKLVVRKQRDYLKILNTSSALPAMKKKGNYDYQQYAFPKIYHGVVSREKLDMVRAKTGHFFGGLTPDIYSAVALSFFIDRILYIDTPFSLPGTSAKSGSADSLTGRHTGEMKNAPHLRGHDSYDWDADIPYLYSVDTIWAETAFKAVKECGAEIALTDGEYRAFLTYLLKNCPMFEDRVAEFYSQKSGESAEALKRDLVPAYKRLQRQAKFRKYRTFGLQLLKGRFVYKNVEDIEAALATAQKRIKNHEKVLAKVKSLNW